MNRENFAAEVEQYLQENQAISPVSAKSAIMTVYDYVRNCANAALTHGRDSEEWCELLFKIQQAMTWTPLRLFWRQLTFDDLLPIRAAAKGVLCDAHGQFAGDEEVAIMGRANLPIAMDLERSNRLLSEVRSDPRIAQAVAEWTTSTQGVGFTPRLQGTITSPPASE